jgi:SAM-dependent methyltransferase
MLSPCFFPFAGGAMSSYDPFARLYDLEHQDFGDDIGLYLNMAERCRAPVGRTSVLELGCGTGRVTVPLAKAGFDLVGVDNSAAMLALARSRVACSGLAERPGPGSVQLMQMDVQALEWTARFVLALFPLNGFLHLTTVQDQVAALRGIHRALAPGGLLIIDLPNPHSVFTPAADGQLYVRRCFQSEQGRPITSLISTQTDMAGQMQHMALFYDEVDADGLVRRTAVEMELRFVYRYEMVGLLRQTGFEVEAMYGSYDLDPYQTDSPIMLFVAHA